MYFKSLFNDIIQIMLLIKSNFESTTQIGYNPIFKTYYWKRRITLDDLFEKMKQYANCKYISDLKFGDANKTAKKMLKEIDVTEYSLSTLNDVAEYLFENKQTFHNIQQASIFFKTYK